MAGLAILKHIYDLSGALGRVSGCAGKKSTSGKEVGSKRIRSTNPSWHGKNQLEVDSPKLVDNEERAARVGMACGSGIGCDMPAATRLGCL